MRIFVPVFLLCSLTFISCDSSENKRTHSLNNNGPMSELHPAEGTMKEMLHHWMNVDKKDQRQKFKSPLSMDLKNKISILLQSPEFRAKIFDKMNDYIEHGDFDAVDDLQNFGTNRFDKFKSQDFKDYLQDQMSFYKRNQKIQQKRSSSFLDDDVNWQDYHKKRNNVFKFSFPPEASKYNSHMRHKRLMPGMIADPHAILEEFSSFLTPDKRDFHQKRYRNPFNRFRFSKKGIQFYPTNSDLRGVPSGNLFSNFQDPEDEIIGLGAYNYNPNQNKLNTFSHQMSQYGSLKKRSAGRSFLTLPHEEDTPNYFNLLSQLKQISDNGSKSVDHNESGSYEVKKRLFGKWDMDNLRNAIRNNNGLMKRSGIWNALMPDQGEGPTLDPWSVDYGKKFVRNRGKKIVDLYSDKLSNH